MPQNPYPFLRVANLLRNALVLDDVHQIELFRGLLERLRLRKSVLLIVEGNGSPTEIGRMAIWDGSIDPCAHQNHLIRARVRAEALPELIAAFWNSRPGRQAVSAVASSTSGLHTLSVSKIKSITIPLPPLPIQREIVERLSNAQHPSSDNAADSCSIALARAARLRRAIASVLLDRIRSQRSASARQAKRPSPKWYNSHIECASTSTPEKASASGPTRSAASGLRKRKNCSPGRIGSIGDPMFPSSISP